MTAQHTPGPWKWERVKDEGAIPEWTLHGPHVLCRYWNDAIPRDARLIAAAPDLLEALKQLTDAHLRDHGGCTCTEYYHARATIAKATQP